MAKVKYMIVQKIEEIFDLIDFESKVELHPAGNDIEIKFTDDILAQNVSVVKFITRVLSSSPSAPENHSVLQACLLHF